MLSRVHAEGLRALSEAHPNTRSLGSEPHGKAVYSVGRPASARAARPLAVSAPARWLAAGASLYAEPALGQEETGFAASQSLLGQAQNSMFGKAQVELGQVTACSEQRQALRSGAKPNAGRAATSFARGGGFDLLASGVTQRTMRAGCVPQNALPNPSIERTSPGKPGAASHLKR
jgi:hypothetical protein